MASSFYIGTYTQMIAQGKGTAYGGYDGGMPQKEMRIGGILRGGNIKLNQIPKSINHKLIIRRQIETKSSPKFNYCLNRRSPQGMVREARNPGIMKEMVEGRDKES
jgi:hypothetical protein